MECPTLPQAEPTLTVRYYDGGHVTVHDPDGYEAAYWSMMATEADWGASVVMYNVESIAGTFRWQRPADPEPVPDNDDLPGPLPGTVDAHGWPVALACTDWSASTDAPAPDLLHCDHLGHGLVYGYDVNWLVGPPSAGKTWVALRCALEAVADERAVLWIEGSGDRNPLHVRCATLGCSEAVDGIRHITSDTWWAAEPEDRVAAIAWLAGGLLVIDAANSTGCGETAESYQHWRRRFLPDGAYGAVVIDHPPKRLVDGERLRGGIGTTGKLTGAACSLYVAGKPWERRGGDLRPGAVTIRVDKDRHGHLGAAGTHIATITGDYDDNGILRLEVVAPTGKPAIEATALSERLVAIIADNPGAPTRDLTKLPGVAYKQAKAALNMLVHSGRVVTRDGPHNACLHYLADDAEQPALDGLIGL